MLQSIKQGNEKAFQEFYNDYYEKLYFYLLGKTKSQYHAQELLQQSFIKLWVGREKLSGEYPLDVQLFRIARSLFIDHLRKAAYERKALEQLSVPETANTTIDQHNARETGALVEKVLETLSPQARTAFRLSREQGLKYHQIAHKLSVSPKTVEYHISKALQRLQKALMTFFM